MLPSSAPAVVNTASAGRFCVRPALPFSVLMALALILVLVVPLLAGCASPVKSENSTSDMEADEPTENAATLTPALDVSGTPWAALSVTAHHARSKAESLEWEIFRAPGKPPTRYRHVQHQGRDAVLALADASGSILRHQFRLEPTSLGRVSFSWHVPDAASGANASMARLEDVPVRVVLAFEGDRSRFSMKNALLSELSQLLTGEPLPYATLIYAWSRVRLPGEVITNDQTDRIRKLVVESGDGGYNQWLSYERDVRADFFRVFGEEPGALTSFAVFTESERGDGPLQAWYGPVVMKPAAGALAAPTR